MNRLLRNCCAALFLLEIACSGSTVRGTDADETIWFAAPATHFTESTPLGNGRLGAMVFGGPAEERIVLSESGMWSGSPQEADRADAAEALPEIRRLLFSGDVLAAERLINRRFTCAGAGSGSGRSANLPYGSFQTLGVLRLEFLHEQADDPPADYRRELDLGDAVATIRYRQGGVLHERTALVSEPDQALVYRLVADRPGGLSFAATLERPERATVRMEPDDVLHMFGQLNDGRDGDAGVKYSAQVRILVDGDEAISRDGTFEVHDATAATILLTAATEIDSFAGRKDSATAAARAELDSAAKRPFVELHRRHVADYRAHYQRARLRLAPPRGGVASAALPTPERLAAAWQGAEDPGLASLYFNFGRYLLISSSRPGGFPANLQGIWTETLQTPWNGDWHLNVNVQMNYWPAEPCNLSALHEPLFALIESLVEPGGKTARAYYDADGWCAHVLANPWGFASPGESAGWGATSTGGAWLCHHLRQHYEFTQDREFLRRAYPTLRGAAEFALDTLVEDPRTGKLVTAPSNSPENSYFVGNAKAHICVGSTMDMQVLRALLKATADAAEILEKDEPFRDQCRAAVERLLPTRIASDGRIMEWSEEVREAEPQHRHVSHLWGLYPGDEIDVRATPKLAEAARKSLDGRGDDGTGWSLAYKIAMWARLGDGERAHKLLRRHFMPISIGANDIALKGGSYPNLFDAHPPFQIDGNFGGTAAIAEMLLQSRLSGPPAAPRAEIDLLPALPPAWRAGEFANFCGRGGIEVSATWRDGALTQARLRSNTRQTVLVRNGQRRVELNLAPRETVTIDGELQLDGQVREARTGAGS
ncbi:MAG: glycoside hydrolase family 95 protein [Pirellulales bacterium]|nr:glycoside hydrolase family 95 protein [Pirellulales bacterium]